MAKREIPEINAGSMADIAFLLLIFFLVTTTMEKEMAMVRMLPKPPEDIPENLPKPPPINERDLMEVLADDKGQLLVRDNIMDIGDLKEFTLKFYKTNKNAPDNPNSASLENTDYKFVNSEEGRNYPYYKKITIENIDKDIQEAEIKISNIKGDGTKELDELAEAVIELHEAEIEELNKRKKIAEYIGPFNRISERIIIRMINQSKTKYGHYISIQDQLQQAIDELRNEESERLWNISYDNIKKALLDDKNLSAQEEAINRKQVLEMLVPGKIVEKQINK